MSRTGSDVGMLFGNYTRRRERGRSSTTAAAAAAGTATRRVLDPNCTKKFKTNGRHTLEASPSTSGTDGRMDRLTPITKLQAREKGANKENT
jgi:hypothetical protein